MSIQPLKVEFEVAYAITKVLHMGEADMSNPIATHKRKKTFMFEPHGLELKWRPRGIRPFEWKDK